MLERLFPLMRNWNNLEMLIGFVLALVLGLWIGWGWAWKKIGFFGLICTALYGAGRLDRGKPEYVLGCDRHRGGGADACPDPRHAGGQALIRRMES